MPTFKVIAGKHIEGTGPDAKEYSGGDVFDSEKDLDKLFAGKFERIGGRTKRPRDHDDTLDGAGRVMDKAEHKKGKAVKAGGPKATPSEDKSVKGARSRGEDPEDEEIPDNEAEEDEEVEDEEESSEGTAEGEESEEEVPDFGADVTAQFQKAADADVQVFKSEDGYTIVKDGEAQSKKPLKLKKQATEAIAKMTKKK